MEQSKDKLEADLTLLQKAVATLETALREPFTEIVRDAVIQRFEYTFELTWKTLQTAGSYMGSVSNSPRESIKSGFQLGWIQHPDQWFEAMEARNRTSHVYNPVVAKEVYEVAKRFPLLVQEVIQSLKKL